MRHSAEGLLWGLSCVEMAHRWEVVVGASSAVVLAAAAIGGCGGAATTTTNAPPASTTPPAGATQTPTAGPSSQRTTKHAAKKPPAPGSGACPNTNTVLAGVYHPDRLRVIDPCRHITGTVVSVSGEEDGDLHFDIRLDPAYQGMLMANNYSEQHGALVAELMPRDHGHLPAPSVGDRVSVTGAYVDDTEHEWAELHPVWALSTNGGRVYRSGAQYGGSPAYAHSADALVTCHTPSGPQCAGYGSTASATTSGSAGSTSSGSSSSSSSSPTSSPSPSSGPTQVVHPGAFCAPIGAKGVTDRGTPMTCKTSATDSRARWRSSG
jgi:hypothetical protein